MATGAANVILDNLIAEGKAKPMVMVNPLGYGTAGGGIGGPDMIAQFAKAMLQEVMPRVEKAYNVSKTATSGPSRAFRWAAPRQSTPG